MWKITSKDSALSGWLRYDRSTMKVLAPGTLVLFDTGDKLETKKWVSHFISDYKDQRYIVAEVGRPWDGNEAYEIRFRKSSKDVIVDTDDLLITDPTSFTDIK